MKILFFIGSFIYFSALAGDYQRIADIGYKAIIVDPESITAPTGKSKAVLVKYLSIGYVTLGIYDSKEYKDTISSALVLCSNTPKYIPIHIKYFERIKGDRLNLIGEKIVTPENKIDLDSIDLTSAEETKEGSIEEAVAYYTCTQAAKYDKSINARTHPSTKKEKNITVLNCIMSHSIPETTKKYNLEFQLGIDRSNGKVYDLGYENDIFLVAINDKENLINIPSRFFPDINRIIINRYTGNFSGMTYNFLDTPVEYSGNCLTQSSKKF